LLGCIFGMQSFVAINGVLSLLGSQAGKALVTFADLANWNSRDSEFLTPPKRLLNSIDIIETVVREELQNLKRTPTTKKVEREKRAKTLMSIRSSTDDWDITNQLIHRIHQLDMTYRPFHSEQRIDLYSLNNVSVLPNNTVYSVKSIRRIKTYEEYELNNTVTRDLDEPWLDNGVPYPLCDYICEPYHFKNGITKWPTCSSDIDGFCNGGELPGMGHKERRDDPTLEPSVYKIRRFEMMKYSFNADEEYIAIKESEYLNHSKDNLDAY
ncbi:uncharacterized mitochondrial protein-like protein, partial [Tanacetum coccineum]